ncbi:MAG: hypothetical protein ABNH02_11335 [Pseudomonadales bacterium]
MRELTLEEQTEVDGGGVILIVGGAFLAGVALGYIAEKTSQFLDGLDDPAPAPEPKTEASQPA